MIPFAHPEMRETRGRPLYDLGAFTLSAPKAARRSCAPIRQPSLGVSSLTWPGAFGLPATFQTLHDPHRSVSELHPLRIAHVDLLSEPSRQTGVFRCAKSLCRGAK